MRMSLNWLGRSTALAAAPLLAALALAPARANPLPLVEGDHGAARVSSQSYSPPVLLTQIASFGAVRVDDWLYVYSGHTGPTHHHSFDNLSPVFARLNLLDGQSWELLPCPERLQSVVLLPHPRGPIRIGGMTAKNRAGEKDDLHSVDSVEQFDPLTRKWLKLPSLPKPRSSHGAALIGDKIYVAGGWQLAGPRALWDDTALVLDLAAETPAWIPLSKPPFGEKRAIGAAVADGKVVFMGGLTSEGEFTKGVHAYDPAQQAWSELPELPFAGFGVGALGVGNDVYASGIDSPLYRLGFHGGEPEWEALTSLMFPRYFHQFVPLGEERLLAVGGVSRPSFSSGARHQRNVHQRTTEVIELSPKRGPVLTRWTLPYPGQAKNRQGVFLHHDSLWAFGGNNSHGQHDFEPHNFLAEGYRLHLGTLRFERLPELPGKRQSFKTVVLPGKQATGYAIGGFGHTGAGTRSWNDLRAFDFAKQEWRELDVKMPSSRTQFQLAERPDGVYLFGGLDYDSSRGKKRSFSFPRSVVVLREGKFEPTKIELPAPRRAYGGALLGERFYLVGGMREGFKLLEHVDVYDFESGEWSQIPAPEPRISPHLIALGGKLYVIGGTTPRNGEAFTPNQRVEVFDPAVGQWETLVEELPVSVRHMQFFAWRERILCYSLHGKGRPHAQLLVIQP